MDRNTTATCLWLGIDRHVSQLAERDGVEVVLAESHSGVLGGPVGRQLGDDHDATARIYCHVSS